LATVLYLVRHGETSLNRERIFQGHLDPELSPLGWEQAKCLALRLKDEKIEAFYSSDLLRAYQTASAIAAKHRQGVIKVKELRGIDCGEWTGKSVEEIEAVYPELLITWRFQPHHHRMPGGESVEQVQRRIIRAWQRILMEETGYNICIVTHAIPVKSLMCHFMEDDLSLIWLAPRQDNGALNIIQFEGGKPRVIEVGSIDHLQDLETPG
jgi:broad specificity phosphatase PhoE